MSTIRPKDTDALSTLASNHEIMVDGPDGFGTLLRDTFLAQVAALIVANPTTYKIATLDGADKLTSSQDPSQPLSYLGTHNASTNSPALADGSGTAGDTYQINVAGTRNYGSGSLTLAVGDALVYNGSIWQQVSGVANILDGISTPAAAQTALEVISADESAEIAGTKIVGPALFFQVNDYIEFSDSGLWSFTDAVDDLPMSIEGFIRVDDFTNNFQFGGKYGTSPLEYTAYVDTSGRLAFQTYGTVATSAVSTEAITAGEWVHVCITNPGAGPNSSNAFSANQNGTKMYINGVACTVTPSNNASYTGMADTAAAFWIARQASTYGKGSVRNLRVWNRVLSASEVSKKSLANSVDFSDEWGGTLGANGTIDETVGKSSWTGTGSITYTNITETANTTVGARANVLKLAATATVVGSETRLFFTSGTLGKRIRVEFDYYIPSTNTQVDGLTALHSGGSVVISETTTDAWTRVSVDMLVGQGGTSTTLQIKLTDGGTDNATLGDYIGIDNFRITPIGVVADLRAENFIADKLIDLSSNNFVGTNNGATLVGGRKALQLDTDGAAAGNKALSVFNGSSHVASITDKGDLDANSISSGASTELTIATGAVTATKSYHTIDTEADAASDDLDTIAGGRAGQMLIIQANNSARSVVLKDGTGNLKLSGDITLDNAEDTATLVSDGTSWYLIATSNNGA